ncbi:MAG: transcription antitermination factor NusB, partial [Candidatus Omnitrophota bacterium]
VEKNKKEIDDIIRKYAANWQLERMAVIDRNILRLGTFEIMFADEIPPKVTINEAVELAKKYGDSESGKFVNGILDKIHKEELLPKDK